MADIEVIPPEPNRAERIAHHVATTATARYSSIFVAFLLTFIIVPAGGWAVNRLITAQDKQAEKQIEIERQFAELHQQVLNIVSVQLQNSKNIQDRIESGEKVLNDRINQQDSWLQKVAAKTEELAKFVYQNIRGRSQ